MAHHFLKPFHSFVMWYRCCNAILCTDKVLISSKNFGCTFFFCRDFPVLLLGHVHMCTNMYLYIFPENSFCSFNAC